MKLISTVFAALLLAAGAAHADLNDKDNHIEGVGGHTLNELQKQGKRPSSFSTRAAQLLQVMPSIPIDSAWRGSVTVEELMMQLLLR